MSKNLDALAKQVRELILEVDTLTHVFNDIHDAYVDEDEELDNSDHPVAKLEKSNYAISQATDNILKILIAKNILDPYFRKSLQMLAMMDALKDSNSAFVEFVNKHVKLET